MPKLYFTRDPISGELVLYHSAPGQDEINVPNGVTFEDVKHLIPSDFDMSYQQPQQQSRHPFWDKVLGQLLGGNSGSAIWRIGSIIFWAWFAFSKVNGIIEYIGTAQEDLKSSKIAIKQLTVFADSTREYEKALGTVEDVNALQARVNLSTTIANRHFPKEVQDFRDQMRWSTGAKQYKIDRGDKQ